MPSHEYTYPKVKAVRPGPSAYERRTKVHEVAPPASERERDKAEPRKRRPAR